MRSEDLKSVIPTIVKISISLVLKMKTLLAMKMCKVFPTFSYCALVYVEVFSACVMCC